MSIITGAWLECDNFKCNARSTVDSDVDGALMEAVKDGWRIKVQAREPGDPPDEVSCLCPECAKNPPGWWDDEE